MAIENIGLRLQNTFQPVRDACRRCYKAKEVKTEERERKSTRFKCLEKTYYYFKVWLFAVKPFASVFILYLEFLKNFWFGFLL